MGSYENFLKRMGSADNTARNDMIRDTKMGLAMMFRDDPSYIQEGTTIYRTDRVVHPRITQSKPQNSSAFVATFQTEINEPIYQGDIIPWPKHGYWLCTESVNLHEENWQGTLRYCNYVYKWQNKAGDVIEEIGAANDYNNVIGGESSNQVINNNETRREGLMQLNDDTRELRLSKRMYLDMSGLGDPKLYKITNIDRICYMYGDKGYFRYTFVEDQENPDTDRPDLMLADYIEPTTPSPSVGLCSISYSGDPIVKAGGSTKTFRAVFNDSDGNVITTIAPNWELELPSLLSDKVTISSQSDDYIKLIATYDETIIGLTFVLKLSADDSTYGHFEYELEITVRGLI